MERPSPFWQLATTRLILRKLEPEDFDSLCRILQDPEVMYAYEGPFPGRKCRPGWIKC